MQAKTNEFELIYHAKLCWLTVTEAFRISRVVSWLLHLLRSWKPEWWAQLCGSGLASCHQAILDTWTLILLQNYPEPLLLRACTHPSCVSQLFITKTSVWDNQRIKCEGWFWLTVLEVSAISVGSCCLWTYCATPRRDHRGRAKPFTSRSQREEEERVGVCARCAPQRHENILLGPNNGSITSQ